MDQVSSSISKLSIAIDNFQVGVTVHEHRSCFEPLKQLEDAFKLRRSKALLESAYKEQHVSTGNSDFSSFEWEKPRLFKREKVRNECQQLATQGMVSFYSLQPMIHSGNLRVDPFKDDTESEGTMKAKFYEFFLELSENAWSSFGDSYSELLAAEKATLDEALRFQEAFVKLKKAKECMTDSTSNDAKMKLSRAQAGLDKMNFMRTLIILLVGVKDVDMSKHKDISNIVLNRCEQLTLLDKILN